jgi:allophanate hydrolase subunit 1
MALMGRTPRRLFDLGKTDPFLLGAGDKVKFKAITRDEFESYQNN